MVPTPAQNWIKPMPKKIKMYTRKHHHQRQLQANAQRKAEQKARKLLDTRLNDGRFEAMMKGIGDERGN